MFTTANLALIVQALLAIVAGSVGIIAVFYGLNLLVERLPKVWRLRLLPWVYVGPTVLLLGAYLVFPALRTFYISFFRQIGRKNFVGGCRTTSLPLPIRDMLIAFRNNVLWAGAGDGVQRGPGAGDCGAGGPGSATSPLPRR